MFDPFVLFLALSTLPLFPVFLSVIVVVCFTTVALVDLIGVALVGFLDNIGDVIEPLAVYDCLVYLYYPYIALGFSSFLVARTFVNLGLTTD